MSRGRKKRPAPRNPGAASRTRVVTSSGRIAEKTPGADPGAGKVAGKVPGSDPAAAPLGTDAETAGAPPPPEPGRLLRHQATPPPGQAADPAGNKRGGYLMQDRLVWLAILLAILVAAGAAIAAGFLV